MKFKCWFSLLCLMLVLACSFALAEDFPGDVHELEWYQTPQPQKEGAAYLNFFLRYNPVRISHVPGDEGLPYRWDIWYGYENLGTADFIPTQITEVYFGENGTVADVFVTNGVGLKHHFPDGVFKPGDVKGRNTMRPAGSETGYGVAVHGVDSNGNDLAFGVYVPLSQQVEVRYTIDYLKNPVQSAEGKPFINIVPLENPAPLVQDEGFSKGAGWYFGFIASKEADAPFTATELLEIYFDHKGDAYPTVFSAEQLQGWGFDLNFADGSEWEFGGGAPIQNIQGVGYVLRGVDAEGNAVSFHTYIEVEQPQ